LVIFVKFLELEQKIFIKTDIRIMSVTNINKADHLS